MQTHRHHLLPTSLRTVPHALGLALLLLLHACGGGGGSGSGGSGGTTTVSGSASCTINSGTCQLTEMTSTTSGGIWVLNNNGSTDQTLSVSVNGMAAGQVISLSLANSAPTSTTMSVPSNLFPEISGPKLLGNIASEVGGTPDAAAPHGDHVRQFKRPPASPLTESSPTPIRSAIAPATTTFSVGNNRIWNHAVSSTVFTPFTATLRGSASLSDGKWVHVWVDDTAWGTVTGKVTASVVNDYTSTFSQTGGIYDSVTGLSQGAIWGTNSDAYLIDANTPDVHVVISAQLSTGELGYFYGLNNYKTSTPSCSNCSHSNEALAIFVNAATVTSGTSGQARIKSTMIHELVHMINFYQRDVSKGSAYAFDSWLEEMVAMMMQDMIETRFISTHTFRDTYMSSWVQNRNYQCSPFIYDANNANTCFSYRVGTVYGGYLMRQYGLSFYRALLASNQTDSLTSLNQAIASVSPSATALTAAAQTDALSIMLDLTSTPTTYKLPAVSGTSGTIAYALPLVALSSYSSYKPSTYPTLTNVPQGGSVVSKFTTPAGTWSKTVTIPANSSLTLVAPY